MARVLPFICIDDIEDEFQEYNVQAAGSTRDIQNTAEVINLDDSTRSDQENSCASDKDCDRESVNHDTLLDSENNDVHKVARITDSRETDSSTHNPTDQAWTDEYVPRGNGCLSPDLINSDHTDTPHEVTQGADRQCAPDSEDKSPTGIAGGTGVSHRTANGTGTTSKKDKCKVCDKYFTSVKGHIKRVHTGYKPHVCDVCNKGFSSNSSLKDHMRSHTGEKPYKCDICAKCFSQRWDLKTHMSTHMDENAHKCKVCDRSFAHARSLKVHVMAIHCGGRPPQCTRCDRKFINPSDLKRHMLNHSSSDRGAGFPGVSQGVAQIEKYKEEGRKYETFQCKICDKYYISSSALKCHTNAVHIGHRPHVCDVCHKAFRANRELIIHMRSHTGDKPYTCTVCAKRFSHKSNLNTHLNIHTGIKPYSCRICSWHFNKAASLSKHVMAKHRGESPFQCNRCDQGFVKPSDLKQHILLHSTADHTSAL